MKPVVLMTQEQAAAPPPVTPAQHHHFLNLGQIMGLALLGLAAYHQQDVAPDGPATLLNPNVATPYIQGILSLFPPAPTATTPTA
jgi:hypothetical protein